MKTRKLFVAGLALVLTMSMAATAFAEEGNAVIGNESFPGNPTTIEVTGSYDNSGDTTELYSVNIAWGAMEFTYNTASGKTWDPGSHTYKVNSGDGTWDYNDGNKITVTNHSSLPVNAAFSFTPESNTGINSGNFSGENINDSSLSLARAAEGSALDAAPSGTAILTLDGALTPNYTGKIGTVTVTLTK